MDRENLRNLDWGESPHKDLAERTAFLRSKRYPPPSKRNKVVKSPFERLSKNQQAFLLSFKEFSYVIEEIDVGTTKPKLELWYGIKVIRSQDFIPVKKMRKPTLSALVKAGFLNGDYAPRTDSESWRSIP